MSEEKKYEELVDGLEKRIGNSEFKNLPPAEYAQYITKWVKDHEDGKGSRFTPKKKKRVKRKKQR